MVRYGDHFDTALDLSIDDAVGKLAENVPPGTSLEVRPKARRARDQSKRARRLANKRLSAILTTDQLTRFQALIQGAGSSSGTDALPGCPPSSTSST